jgi:hypothetical protein
MTVNMAPEEIEARLREASRVSDLAPDRRLDSKIDLSPEGIRARLLEASSLLDACLALGRFAR